MISQTRTRHIPLKETEALVILSHIHPSNKTRELLTLFGSAVEALVHQKDWELVDSWKKDLELMDKHQVHVIPCPKFEGAPALLYIKGALLPEDAHAVAIVGTRQCSLYGREMAETFGEECAANGYTVISGLARGIDTFAHIGALKAGRTIAVLGSGLDHIYPKENQKLSDQIASQGALISAFPMNTPPAKYNFPKRNRLVSHLSQGTLLIEAPVKSGAMITMEIAQNQNKSCFALPGRVDSESFKGNHYLIKKRQAMLVENAAEMLSLLQGKNFQSAPSTQLPLFDLDPEEQTLIELFPHEEISLEQLSLRSKMTTAKLSSLLMGLVLKGKVREFPGKLYKAKK